MPSNVADLVHQVMEREKERKSQESSKNGRGEGGDNMDEGYGTGKKENDAKHINGHAHTDVDGATNETEGKEKVDGLSGNGPHQEPESKEGQVSGANAGSKQQQGQNGDAAPAPSSPDTNTNTKTPSSSPPPGTQNKWFFQRMNTTGGSSSHGAMQKSSSQTPRSQSISRSNSMIPTSSNIEDDDYESEDAHGSSRQNEPGPLKGPFTRFELERSSSYFSNAHFNNQQQQPQTRPSQRSEPSKRVASIIGGKGIAEEDEGRLGAAEEDRENTGGGRGQGEIEEDDTEQQPDGNAAPTMPSTTNAGGEGKGKQRRGSEANPARHRWAALKSKLGPSTSDSQADNNQKIRAKELSSHLTGQELIAELQTGFLPIVMLKMSLMDLDEHGQHRIPILMNYLKLRLTDSVHPLHDTHAVFRIELEYGDGLLKWVIYRELRDFLALHANYRVANVRTGLGHGKGHSWGGSGSKEKDQQYLTSGGEEEDEEREKKEKEQSGGGGMGGRFPAFPKTALPYLNLLKSQGGEVSRAEFARMQREALESYLLKLIRAVMFRPEANRLCKFLEISALSIHLAAKGGHQGKQGYLRIMSSGGSRKKKPGLAGMLALKSRHEPKWFLIRESYIAMADEPHDTDLYDVFIFDSDFEIERPKRLYKKGLSLFDHLRKDQSDETATHLGDTKGAGDPADPSTTDIAQSDPKTLRDASSHTFYITNAERKLKLVAKNERQMDQFIASIEKVAARSIWAGRNRFGSFAPIRLNVAAQWLIDGRDYFWNLSRAIYMAKEKIYIHDWWLSPELYLRRPPSQNKQWRLDRLLERKAKQGVKIFVIVYKEVSNDFTPVDSNYTKTRLLGLHPNIMVQRSPSHTSAGTLLWSHHEKMCVIDETIAFMGGLDLCFGRWDTPGHTLVDDSTMGFDDIEGSGGSAKQKEKRSSELDDIEEMDLGPSVQDAGQIWPGKDYANSRVEDFVELTKPGEDQFDRSKIPRQPWHDIGLQIVGQPARDLCRHFIQRWNYLLRTKNHTRIMPFLLPPPDFTVAQLQQQRIQGTCETQICRSASTWSIGTPGKTENSIQEAYIKAIELSDHFVYIENQFFVTSTVSAGVQVENKIGDALVSRIIKAHHEGTAWRAIVIIPLIPGYPFPLDHPDASAVRLIIECQYRSICRGPTSLFARLRNEGIDPDEYITFFSLRSWGKMKDGSLSTQDAMIVDDRLAIIGSANINERSQRGDRDSELACVIRDTDMIDGSMGGQPYKVGRFAHSMRVRLMREHVGVDVDVMEAEEANMDMLDRKPVISDDKVEAWDPKEEQEEGAPEGGIVRKGKTGAALGSALEGAGNQVTQIAYGIGEMIGLKADQKAREVDHAAKAIEKGFGHDRGGEEKEAKQVEESEGERIASGEIPDSSYAGTVVPTIEEKVIAEGRPRGGSSEKGGGSEDKSMPKGGRGPIDLAPTHKEEGEGHDLKLKGKRPDATRALGQSTTQGEGEGNLQDSRQLSPNGPGFAPKDEPEDIQKAKGVEPSHGQNEWYRKLQLARDTLGGGGGGLSNRSRAESLNGHSDGPTDDSSAGAGTTNATGTDSGYDKSNDTVANSNNVTAKLKRHLSIRNNAAYTLPTPRVDVDPYGFDDPLVDTFYKNVWMSVATRNTQAFRQVFRCTPDDLVLTWKTLKEWEYLASKHQRPVSQRGGTSSVPQSPLGSPTLGPVSENTLGGSGSNSGRPRAGSAVSGGQSPLLRALRGSGSRASAGGGDAEEKEKDKEGGSDAGHGGGGGTEKSKKDKGPEGFTQYERDRMEEVLKEIQGHLVIFPTRFLEDEGRAENFLFPMDRVPPIAIYN